MATKFGFVGPVSDPSAQVVIQGFKNAGVIQVETPDWDILWYNDKEPPRDFYKHIPTGRRINHIPGISVLTNKWSLFQNLSNAYSNNHDKDNFPRYFPKSYLWPDQKDDISKIFDCGQWLIKPRGGSWGRYIRRVNDVSEMPISGEWLVQEYLDDVHLIDGCKYNLRLYLLIVNTNPLTAYLYNEGCTDLCVIPYEPGHDPLVSDYMYNTNSGVQSTHPDYDAEIHCRTIEYWQSYASKTTAGSNTWAQIEKILIDTLNSITEPLQATTNKLLGDPRMCFELIGLDMMIDSNMQPWLIECNRGPAMTPEYSGNLKYQLIEDMIGLIIKDLQLESENYEPLENWGGFQRLKI